MFAIKERDPVNRRLDMAEAASLLHKGRGCADSYEQRAIWLLLRVPGQRPEARAHATHRQVLSNTNPGIVLICTIHRSTVDLVFWGP